MYAFIQTLSSLYVHACPIYKVYATLPNVNSMPLTRMFILWQTAFETLHVHVHVIYRTSAVYKNENKKKTRKFTYRIFKVVISF